MSRMKVAASAFLDELEKTAVGPLAALAIPAAKMIGSSMAIGAGMNALSGLGKGKKLNVGTRAPQPAPIMNAAPNGTNYTY